MLKRSYDSHNYQSLHEEGVLGQLPGLKFAHLEKISFGIAYPIYLVKLQFLPFRSDENKLVPVFFSLSRFILVKATVLAEREFTLRFNFISLFTIRICKLLLQLQLFGLNVKLSAKISLISCQLSSQMKYIIFSTAKSPIADRQPSGNVFQGWKV